MFGLRDGQGTTTPKCVVLGQIPRHNNVRPKLKRFKTDIKIVNLSLIINKNKPYFFGAAFGALFWADRRKEALL